MQTLILECAVRAALIAICTGTVLFLLRVKAARVRHAVWASVVIAMLVLPVWTAWGPKAVVLLPNPAAPPMSQPVLSTANSSMQSSTGTLHSETPQAPIQSLLTLQNALAGIYLLGLCVLLARLGIGTVRARLLIRRAAKRDGRLVSDSCAAPITVGWLSPAVLLPESSERWSQSQLDAVLAHENEHARRRDPLVQGLALLNRAVFWFHPLAWWLERRLSALAEEACDAAVLARGHDPLQYSECLLEIARGVRQSGSRVTAVGMAMPGTFLPQRIRQILEGRPAQAISRGRVTCVAVACAVLSTVFTAGAVDYMQAVNSPKPLAIAAPAVNLQVSKPTSTRTPQKTPPVLLAQAQPTSRQRPATAAGESLVGTVEDPSGARVPFSCVITVRDQDGEAVAITNSDAAGAYHFGSLPSGHYNVEYAAPGFALKTVRTDIEGGKQARIDAVLDVGQTLERVTVTGGVSGGVSGGVPGGVSGGVQAPAIGKPARIRVGGMVQPVRLLQKVQPVYPPELEKQGIVGTVLIRSVISREGVPLNPHVLNTDVDPRLAQAALDSVRQWRYQPSLLNGEPIETSTTITIEFLPK